MKKMTHKDLNVYKRSMKLVKLIYQLTSKFPSSEKFGLTNQMRRCAVSIPSNIAEGAARNSRKEYIRFLYISRVSASELETQYTISKDLDLCKENPEITDSLNYINKALYKLIQSLSKTN